MLTYFLTYLVLHLVPLSNTLYSTPINTTNYTLLPIPLITYRLFHMCELTDGDDEDDSGGGYDDTIW